MNRMNLFSKTYSRHFAFFAGRFSLFVFFAAFCSILPSPLSAATNYPSWWTNRNMISTAAGTITNDYAAANSGQLKWFATNAYDELNAWLPGGAGTNVQNLIQSFSSTNNYYGMNLGQLKNTAKPFYDRLIAEGYTNAYPWTSTTTDDVDYAAANLGQMKYVFSFDPGKDADGDSLPDWWEIKHFGDLSKGAMDDPDQDFYPNIFEYHHDTAPTNSGSIPSPITNVVCNGDSQAIKDAIAAAPDWAVIMVGPGTYSGGNIQLGSKPVMVIAQNGPTNTIIDSGWDDYGFVMDGTVNVVISGMQVIHSSVAAWYVAAGTLAGALDMWFIGDNDDYNGVVIEEGARAWAWRCASMGHAAYGFYVHNGATVTIEDSIISGNGDTGVLNYGGDLSIDACKITGNGGDGVYNGYGSGDLEIRNCVVAESYYDGIEVQYGSCLIESCVIVTNGHTEWEGSGVRIWSSCDSATVKNSTIMGNVNRGMTIDMSNTVVRNCIVVNNTEWQCVGEMDMAFSMTSGNPQVVPGVYWLKSSSPCIDAGTDTGAPTTDIQGEERWDDPAHSNVASAVDIGADEFVDTDDDGMADIWEIMRFGSLNEEAAGDYDNDGKSNLAEYEDGETSCVIEIKAENGVDAPREYLGVNEMVKYRAVLTQQDGGRFLWQTLSGNITLSNICSNVVTVIAGSDTSSTVGAEVLKVSFIPFSWHPPCQTTQPLTVLNVELKNPKDSNGDGVVNDFAHDWNTNSGNVFGFTNASGTTNCIIPCRVKISPDTPEVRSLYTDQVRIRLSPIGTSHNASGPYVTTISWDNPFPGETTAGKGVYNSTSGYWIATATFAGLPAVPSNSWGRVPAGLHDLLYGSKTTTVSTLGTGALPDVTNLYEVYYGDSLVVNGSRLVDIQAYSNDVNTLVAGESVRREMYEKMCCATETFEFTNMTKASENFTMRKQAMLTMDGIANELVDVLYAAPGNDPPVYPSAGDTYVDTNTMTWNVGSYWNPYLPTNVLCATFYQTTNTSAYTAIYDIYPFRGECLGVLQISVFQAAADALGSATFDALHASTNLWLATDSYAWRLHTTSVSDTNTFVPGDYVYMKNKYDYNPTNGPWQGENCIYMGTNGFSEATFAGMGVEPVPCTETQLRELLRVHYTNDMYPNIVSDPATEIYFTTKKRLLTGN